MNQKNWHLWVFAFLVIVACALRYPFWGVLSYSQLQGWSAQSLNFAANWVDEGYFFLKGMLYHQAASIEFLDPASRVAYYTPSSFFVLPVYWLSKLSGFPPHICVVNFFSLVLQLFLAYGVGALSYTLLEDFKEKHRKIAFLGSAIFILFAPKIFISYTLSYWSDLLVLPFIVYTIFIELLLKKRQKNYQLSTYQQILIFLACLSDIYGFVFSLTLLGYHSFKKDWKRVGAVAIPLVFALSITIFHISKMGQWSFVRTHVFGEFGMRFGYEMSLGSILSGIFVKHLGILAFVFLLSFGIAEYLQRKKMLASKFLLLFFLSPILYTLLMAAKSMNNELSALKYYIPAAVFFFGVLPALFFSYADGLAKKKAEEKYLFKGLSCVPAVLVIVLLAMNYPSYLESKKFYETEAKQVNWLRSITQPEQILFSNYLLLNFSPPQSAFLLRKPIWKFNDSENLQRWKSIFRDVADYPLLWLDKVGAKGESCAKIYKEFGGQSISSHEGIDAFLFPSVEKFVSIPEKKLNECIASP